MALVDRLKKKNAEARIARKHPLIEMGADLNVRTAYFQGLALVALVDDDKIDAVERSYLQNLGIALGMTAGDVVSAIDEVVKLQCDVDQQEELVSDVVSTMDDQLIHQLFLAELTRISIAHKHDWEKVIELRSAFAETMRCDLQEHGFKLYDEILCGFPKTFEKVPLLEKQFPQRMLDYLFPDYLILIKKDAENRLKEKTTNREKLPAKLVEVIEGDDRWPIAFDAADYVELFRAAGVEDVKPFVCQVVLPRAKMAYERVKDLKDHGTGWINDGEDYEYHGVIFERSKEYRILFRYAAFLDAYLNLVSVSSHFYFCGPSKLGFSYCRVIMRSEDLSYERWHTSGGSPNCFEHNCALDRLQCSSWSPSGKDFERYFMQWDGLFLDIDKLLVQQGG